jgi:MOSC domain-containing protein YiiM
MAPIPEPDLWAPWQKATLIQVRTSKMAKMRGLNIYTGIYKMPRTTRVFCSSIGLESDEHDLTFHGGVDKAVHQYYPGHYKDWKKEHPEAADAFEIGGFGENLVANGNMNERNVCIGDLIRVGGQDGVLLQVSLPRVRLIRLAIAAFSGALRAQIAIRLLLSLKPFILSP